MTRLLTLTLCAALSFPAQAATNLLSNAGFEDGLTDWSSSGNAAIRSADPAAYEGTNYVYGQSTPLFSVWQDIDLLAAGVSAGSIDGGFASVTFGGFQSGWNTQTDYGQIGVSFLDEAMGTIASVTLDAFYSNHTWAEQSGVAAVVAGTRTIRYEFTGTRVSGSNNDAFLDAAYLSVSAVPEPETYAMLLAGLALIGGVARRRQR